MANRHSRRTDGQRPSVELASRSVAQFCSLAYKLVECGEDVVSKLDLSYCRLAHRRKPDTETSYALSAEEETR